MLDDSDDEKELKIKKNTLNEKFLNGIEKTSVFTRSIKQSLENKYNDNIYINTENNIFSVKNEKDKKDHRKFNLKNYEQIFKQNREKNFFTLKEENNAEIIKNIFDIIKEKKKKRNKLINKMVLTNKDKINKTKYDIYNTFTNPNALRTTSNRTKKKTLDSYGNYSYEEDYNKIKTLNTEFNSLYQNNAELDLYKNRKIYPNINSIRKDIINLDTEAKVFNKHIKWLRFNELKNVKNKLNITSFKSNKLTMDNLNFNEIKKKKTFIKNKRSINRYVKKLNNFKYNNNLINKFFETKKENVKKVIKTVPKINWRNNENDEYYFLRDTSKIKNNPVLNKFNIIKKMFKSQIDKEIFHIFNKKI